LGAVTASTCRAPCLALYCCGAHRRGGACGVAQRALQRNVDLGARGARDEMAQYVGAMAAADVPDTSSGAFLSAVLSVRRGDYGVAKGAALPYPNPASLCACAHRPF